MYVWEGRAMNLQRLSDRQINLIMILLAGIVYVGVSLVSTAEKALASAVAFGVFFAIISVKLEIKNQNWQFWATILIFAAIHVVAIAMINFPEPRFGLVSLPFALVDGFIMWCILSWIDKRFAQTPNGTD